MRLSGTKTGAINQYRGLGNQLWDLAGNRPSLDLPFADNKSLVDATTGSNLVDFTRASSGTYVDSEGVIRTATTNLLLRSEEFDDAVWTKTRSSVTNNVAVAPNDTLAGDKLAESVDSGTHVLLQGRSDISAGTLVTASVFLKAAERTFASIGAAAGGAGTGINLLTGELVDVSVPGWTNATVSGVLSAANGWWRVYFQFTAVGNNALFDAMRIFTHDGTGTNYTGDGTSGIYIWGAQLEQSTTVGEYIPTTSTINSAPRFDHDPTTGESLGLLVEESRTNNFEWSNSATNGETWNNVDSSLSLASGQSDPAGGTAGIRATDADSASTGTFLQRTYLANLTASTTVTYSIWLKPIDCPNDVLILNIFANTITDSIYATFSVSGTDITAVSTSANGTGAASGASFEAFPNGWYRCRLTGVPSTVTMNDVRARVNLGSYQRAAGTARFDWYGAQFESGAFATSYIPTTGATATRAADVASISGSNFSGWYRQDEGTVFTDLRLRTLGSSGFPRMIAFVQADPNSSDQFAINTRNLASVDDGRFFGTVGDGSVFGDFQPPAGSPAFSAKIALSAKQNDGAFAVAGYPVFADNTLNMPSPIELRLFGQARFQSNSSGWIKRLTYWPARLPDSTLQTITQ